ncbi:MAG: hypothetical protein ACQESR_28930 [Planctomycetota bacterium]
MERCSTQAVLPLVGLTAQKVIRDRYRSTGMAYGRTRPNRSRTGIPAASKPTAANPKPPRRATSSPSITETRRWIGAMADGIKSLKRSLSHAVVIVHVLIRLEILR